MSSRPASGLGWTVTPEALAAMRVSDEAVRPDPATAAVATAFTARERASLDRRMADEAAVDAMLEVVSQRWWNATRPGWVSTDWFDASIRPEVRALLSLPLGSELLCRLEALPSGPCPADHHDQAHPGEPTPGSKPGFPCACQVVVTAAWQALSGWLSASGDAQLVAAAGARPIQVQREHLPQVTDPVREELAAAMRLSPLSAHNRIAAARDLCDYPDLLALVESGVISAWTARTLLGECANLSPEARDHVISTMVDVLSERHRQGLTWTAGQILQAVRRRILALPERHRDQARKQARKGRRVEVWDDADGMATLAAKLREVDAARIYQRLTAIAAGLKADLPGDDRTVDQRRADIFTDLLLGHTTPTTGVPAPKQPPAQNPQDPQPQDPQPRLSRPHGPQDPRDPQGPEDRQDRGRRACNCGGQRPYPAPGSSEVALVIPITTLLGLTDEPGHVPGLGPIDADTARELAADAKWRAWLTDTDGHVTTVSPHTYTPSTDLARLIRARHPYCRYPGCTQPAASSDLDHVIPYPRGKTTGQNLRPLCRRHHRLKTYGLFDLTPNPDDPHTVQWHTPAGITITVPPQPPLLGTA